jgi:hypothetical protein
MALVVKTFFIKNTPKKSFSGREKNDIYTGKIRPQIKSFSHPDYTVGFGIAPNQPNKARRLYCRWGISPRPKESIYILLRFNNFVKQFLITLQINDKIIHLSTNTFSKSF